MAAAVVVEIVGAASINSRSRGNTNRRGTVVVVVVTIVVILSKNSSSRGNTNRRGTVVVAVVVVVEIVGVVAGTARETRIARSQWHKHRQIHIRISICLQTHP